MIDYSLLTPTLTEDELEQGCRTAARQSFKGKREQPLVKMVELPPGSYQRDVGAGKGSWRAPVAEEVRRRSQ